MTTLVVGASGATGMNLVEQLLILEQKVKVIVRSPEKLPESWKANDRLSIIKANISEITEVEMVEYLKDCDSVASCLGHNINLKGIFGKPRRLVTDAVSLICESIKKNAANKPTKFVLMNTSGNSNRDLEEHISMGQRLVIGLIRILLPPHIDNEKAADYLRVNVSQNDNFIEWVAVRPDGLVNEDEVTKYELHASPIRSAIFEAGSISRINVGNFMARLIVENELWNKWKGQMPVMYSTALKND